MSGMCVEAGRPKGMSVCGKDCVVPVEESGLFMWDVWAKVIDVTQPSWAEGRGRGCSGTARGFSCLQPQSLGTSLGLEWDKLAAVISMMPGVLFFSKTPNKYIKFCCSLHWYLNMSPPSPAAVWLGAVGSILKLGGVCTWCFDFQTLSL